MRVLHSYSCSEYMMFACTVMNLTDNYASGLCKCAWGLSREYPADIQITRACIDRKDIKTNLEFSLHACAPSCLDAPITGAAILQQHGLRTARYFPDIGAENSRPWKLFPLCAEMKQGGGITCVSNQTPKSCCRRIFGCPIGLGP